jgi:cysteinyl-tRNA synthetase
MKLHNSLTKTSEEFTPIEPGKTRLYSCGPTVYNNLHIGNLSAFIYADLLRRTLAVSGYDVTAVMNITDVDDKTIRDSKRDYPELAPREALAKLTAQYEEVFKNDIGRIGNDLSALTFIRATDTIAEMIKLTQILLDKGFAYPAEDGIYFSIKNYEEAGFTYGQLQPIDRTHEHARIANDEYDKDSVSDFALWKKTTAGEPSWPATFTHENQTIEMAGRPGWHIECSAMSEKLLGIPFDIHTGGIDLKFPHHENEIAQSAAASGNAILANYFVHNNHILIDGRKMSKSLGNVITLREIEEKGFDPLAFRLLVLSSHYSSESNFSWDILEAAQNRLRELRAWADLRHQPSANTMPDELDNLFKETRDGILAALQDNLNTPEALAVWGKLVSYMQTIPIPGVEGKFTDGTLAFLDDVFGLALSNRPDITNEQKQLIAARETARANKDWAESDRLRDALKDQDIIIRDTSNGPVWERA